MGLEAHRRSPAMTLEERYEGQVSVFERSATPLKCQTVVAGHTLTFEKIDGEVRETSDLVTESDAGPLPPIFKRVAKTVAERYMSALDTTAQEGPRAAH